MFAPIACYQYKIACYQYKNFLNIDRIDVYVLLSDLNLPKSSRLFQQRLYCYFVSGS